ncbi:MAG: TetR/AcrR family transcriptional regulator, partial [Deltaproteobacteria bacterium]|nr:TetR/AcrR family transcriptional regulator [Deltaproteobacteria bacterium]
MTKKAEILATATHLLAMQGYSQMTMSTLARMTGVAHGTIFYHFNNKTELFLEILKEFKAEILREYQRHCNDSTPQTGLQQLEGAVAFYLHLSAQMADRFLLLHRHDAYELSQVNPDCRRHLEAIYDCFIGMFEQAIRAGQADGTLAAQPTAHKAALLVFTMVDGLVRFNTYNLYDAHSL